VDYYSKESVDLIYDKPLPGSTGNTEIITNVGAKKLWLGSSNSRNIVSADFIWTTGLNFLG
jgi:hypothetical protein